MNDTAAVHPNGRWDVAVPLLLTLWVGATWAIGYLAVPILFASLEDRMLAGALAGKMFHAEALLGLLAGGLLALTLALQAGSRWLADKRLWLIAAMLLLTAVGAFVLQPQMAALKAAGLPDDLAGSDFARLHGIASALYLLRSGLGLALVLLLARRMAGRA